MNRSDLKAAAWMVIVGLLAAGMATGAAVVTTLGAVSLFVDDGAGAVLGLAGDAATSSLNVNLQGSATVGTTQTYPQDMAVWSIGNSGGTPLTATLSDKLTLNAENEADVQILNYGAVTAYFNLYGTASQADPSFPLLPGASWADTVEVTEISVFTPAGSALSAIISALPLQ